MSEPMVYIVAMPLEDRMKARERFPDFPWDKARGYDNFVRAQADIHWFRREGTPYHVILKPEDFHGIREEGA